jgi:2-oxo-4-hydroxy-4-carboxy-5-ureidoimidazoline decarboxylase
MTTRIELHDLNTMNRAGFVAALDGIFEHAPWVAERAWTRRPFATVEALHVALCEVLAASPIDEQTRFLQGHPDLAGQAARQRAMTAESVAEQGGLGLDRLDEAEFARFEAMNRT